MTASGKPEQPVHRLITLWDVLGDASDLHHARKKFSVTRWFLTGYPMSELPEGTQIWLRSFYGFSPEEDGYVGWTQESARNRKLEQLNDGDLLMIYGASSAETEATLRSYVLGFVQIDATPIHDVDKASDLGMARKREAGWDDKWSYAMPVRRAWRAEEKMMISRIAFNSYRPEAGQALAVHGAALDDEEIAQALKIRVREVNVFGEPQVTEEKPIVRPFADAFKPSHAIPGSFGGGGLQPMRMARPLSICRYSRATAMQCLDERDQSRTNRSR